MAETLYPRRQRCKACRKAFAGTDPVDGKPVVLDGLYCSYRCAGAAAPPSDPAAANRQCAMPASDGRPAKFKVRYRAESEVPDTLRDRADRTVYRCPSCRYLHVGTRQVRTAKERMRVTESEELAALLVKARGKATRRQVAEVAGIRPIRIKEWEEGEPKADPAALFALLRVYRMGLEVTFT